MLLSEIFDQLAYGELSKLHVSGENGEGIRPEHYNSMVSHINLGLTKLHTRFALRTSEVIVQLNEGVNTYSLSSKYSVSANQSDVPFKYIIDTPEAPFTDNILKVERVVDELGEVVFLNDSDEIYSVYTPTYNTLQVPEPSDEMSLCVLYRANHPKLSTGNVDPSTVEVDIPETHLEALLYFIAARVHSSIPDINGNTESSIFEFKYEQSCQRLITEGVEIRDNNSIDKLRSNGWV